jgi:outer membrane protein insertion porin family
VEKGKFTTGALLPIVNFNNLDLPHNPSKGWSVAADTKYSAEFLGSDLNYFRSFLEIKYYHPLPRSILPLKIPPVILLKNVLGFAKGVGGDELPLYERFFIGGARNLRGFNFRDVGPKDGFGNPLGGAGSFLFSAEISFPLISGFKGLFFFDAGNVYLEEDVFDLGDLRFSIGPGFSAQTPFGPVSIYWGYKLNRRSGEKAGEFHFDLGRGF